VEPVFSEERARRLLQAMNEQQATGRTDVDVFPAAVAEEVGIVAATNTFFAAVGHLEAEGYLEPSPNATLVGARVFRITQKGMTWLETPWPKG
jgi:CRISPR/Cas system-associated protein Cas7 (RAMP superfamily)